jgi:hypothetical protein
MVVSLANLNLWHDESSPARLRDRSTQMRWVRMRIPVGLVGRLHDTSCAISDLVRSWAICGYGILN